MNLIFEDSKHFNKLKKEHDLYGQIYLIRNDIDNKVYIGQSCFSLKRRYKNSVFTSSNGHLKNSILKYGIENFDFVECYDFAKTKEELDSLEIFWIHYFGGHSSKKTYNIKDGGSKGLLSEKEKQRRREYMASLTTEQRSEKYGKKGKFFSDETKRRISEAKLNAENKDEIIKKIVAKISKKVICLNNNMIFNSMKEAGAFYRINPVGIGQCCNGKIKYSGLDKNGIPLKWQRVIGVDGHDASLV